MRKTLSILVPLIIAIHASAEPSLFAIFGRDDRTDMYEVRNTVANTAMRSVVLLAYKTDVNPAPAGSYLMTGVPYGESEKLCRSERFWDQTAYGFCTGILISANIVLTAGHCVVNEKDCENTRMVFDVKYNGPGDIDEQFSSQRVRDCKKIIKRQNRNGLDYALLELSAKVTDRKPIALSDLTNINRKVFMIGHPMGLPAKYTGPANIFSETKLEWNTDLDTWGGNSGSPVFESSTGALVGILTAGEDGDFEDTKNQCRVSKKCTTKTCFGGIVLKSQSIRQSAGI